MPETEVATETRERSRGGLFGRRKNQQEEEPETYRSETEWVDTLQAYTGEDEEVAAPFNGESLTGLPEVGSYQTPEDRAGWRRRSNESMEEIENYIDNVLGTPHDPLRKMTRPTRRDFGIQERVQRARVEGIDHEIMIAFPFPADEFAGARVVYETEGGYVLEVKRNRGKNTETHHFTVSKVGEVAHVLDKLRKFDHKELERAIAEQAAQDRHERTEKLPEKYQASTGSKVQEEVSEAEPALVDRQAPDTPTIPSEHASAPSEAPATSPTQWPEQGPAETQKKGIMGRFGRKKDDADVPSEPATEAAASDEVGAETSEKKGLMGRFGRKKDAAPESEPEPAAEEPGEKKGLMGRFGRK